jgi:class 3 adenylate cyclase
VTKQCAEEIAREGGTAVCTHGGAYVVEFDSPREALSAMVRAAVAVSRRDPHRKYGELSSDQFAEGTASVGMEYRADGKVVLR